ncbi:hypothetical protein D6T64_16020 [Cryobacterium melibiosiphilum]|uniref:Uncharacterized protein n=2 Tax=Cryobacterium melibiosiphilum TaxID=995039 RepID=A0A3A5MAV4_9MICO|nr:hypothetical protein D6T64_16020 [Cryobacterium melibiosiphilum]
MAAQIFNGLVAASSTSYLHWAEAFEISNGLTMEFTHLLTKGVRLQQVIDDQISERLHLARDLELEILSICGVSGQWGASVPLDSLLRQVHASDFEARRAIERLVTEHMIIKAGERLTAIHQLRSTAIAVAIHRTPPPHLRDSVAKTLPLLHTDDIASFTASALTARSDLDTIVLDAALASAPSVARFIAYLHGLRAASFSRRAMRWVEIAESHSVVPAKRAYIFQWAVAEIDTSVFPKNVQAAVKEMADSPTESLAARLLGDLDPAALKNVLIDSALDELPQLFAELRDANPEQIKALVSAARERRLVASLSTATLPQIGDIISAAMTVGHLVGVALCESAGGQGHLLDRFASETPWILEAEIRKGNDGLIGYARILQHAELDQSDHAQAVAIGRRLLRLFPDITEVDVAVLLPGGHALVIGEHNFAATGLIRRNDITEREVSWNQERIIRSVSLIAESDTTRLFTALGLIDRLILPLAQLATSLVTGRQGSRSQPNPVDLISSISKAANDIGPAFGATYTTNGKFNTLDDVSGFITDVTDNLIPRMLKGTSEFSLLAAHLRDHILSRSLVGIKNQRWYLVGLDHHPAALDELEDLLESLYLVLYECGRDASSGTRVLMRAKSARAEWALKRGAAEAHRLSTLSSDAEYEEFRRAIAPLSQATALKNTQTPGKFGTRALSYEVATVLEWPQHLGEVIEFSITNSESMGNDIVVAPTCQGLLLAGMEVRIYNGKAWPGADLDEMRAVLPPTSPAPLFDQVRGAFDALSQLYTARDLPTSQLRIPTIAQFKIDAQQTFAAAMVEVESFPSDAVTIELKRLLRQFARDIEDLNAPNLASALVAGLLFGEDDASLLETTAAVLLARQWDIDRKVALAVLDAE